MVVIKLRLAGQSQPSLKEIAIASGHSTPASSTSSRGNTPASRSATPMSLPKPRIVVTNDKGEGEKDETMEDKPETKEEGGHPDPQTTQDAMDVDDEDDNADGWWTDADWRRIAPMEDDSASSDGELPDDY